MADKKKAGPDTPSVAWQIMNPRWALVNTLLGGTEAMRAAGDAFLPRHEGESDEAFEERLSTARLLNITEQTLATWVGKPFSEPLVSDELPEKQQEWFDNVDKRGNNLDVWARNWFRDGLASGLTHAIVDFPRVQTEEDRPRTLEDDLKEKRRPYFVHVKPWNVLYAHATYVDGQEVLDEVRILEEVWERDPDGWEDVLKRRLKIYLPGVVIVLEEDDDKKKDDDDRWVEIDRYEYDLTYIPMVTFYSEREDFMVAKSPLLDLAYLNAAHWQSQSDQTRILTVSRFPILAGSGVVKEDEVKVGPNQMLITSDPQGRYYYVEHSGNAINAGRQDLVDLEDQMKGYGAEFLKKRPGRETATARALDSSESMSGLQAVVLLFQDAISQLYAIAADWQGLSPEEAGTVRLDSDFRSGTADSRTIDALRDLRNGHDISREGYLNELKKHDILSEDFDIKADMVMLEDEMAAFTGAPDQNIDPGADDPVPPQDNNGQ
jgi:hypothetical protein